MLLVLGGGDHVLSCIAFRAGGVFLGDILASERPSVAARLGDVANEVAEIQTRLSGVDAQYAQLQRQLEELIATSATSDQVNAVRAHHVVLREDLRGPAARYAELRQVVESRFYFYRPLGG